MCCTLYIAYVIALRVCVCVYSGQKTRATIIYLRPCMCNSLSYTYKQRYKGVDPVNRGHRETRSALKYKNSYFITFNGRLRIYLI